MMKLSTQTISFLAIGALLFGAPAANASSPDPAQARVAQAYGEIQKLAAEAKDAQAMTSSMDGVMSQLVDYDAFARRTLKGTWKTLSGRERARFKKAFKALILKTYARRFKPGATFEVTWRGEPRPLDETGATVEVRSTVAGQKASADVDYIMVRNSKAWRAHDIVVDEVSMAMNWRKQFKSIIAKSGFNSLVERIEKKVKK